MQVIYRDNGISIEAHGNDTILRNQILQQYEDSVLKGLR